MMTRGNCTYRILINYLFHCRSFVNVTPGATDLAQWYKLIVPVANKLVGTRDSIYICYTYLSKYDGPISAYSGVQMIDNYLSFTFSADDINIEKLRAAEI